jgi:hypothetical protein
MLYLGGPAALRPSSWLSVGLGCYGARMLDGRRFTLHATMLALAVPLASAVAVSCGAGTSPPAITADDSHAVPTGVSGFTPGQPGLGARRATGMAEVGEALRALETEGDACGSACPSLADLRVGVTHLCSVDDNKDDVTACKEARAQLVTAQTTLVKWCGGCKPPPDGGANDDDAEPVP